MFVLSYSGGMDSLCTFLILRKYFSSSIVIKKPILVFFDYGQKARKVELYYAQKVANDFDAMFEIVNVNNIFNLFANSSNLLNADRKSTMEDESESMQNYVPMRNLIFLSIVSAIAENSNYKYISFGTNLTESMIYNDNTHTFCNYLRDVLNVSGKYPVKLLTPLINHTKTEIISILKYLLGSFEKIDEYSISCYFPIKNKNGKYTPCNNCGSCYLRNQAMKRAKEKYSDKNAETYIEYAFKEIEFSKTV